MANVIKHQENLTLDLLYTVCSKKEHSMPKAKDVRIHNTLDSLTLRYRLLANRGGIANVIV